MSKEKQSNEVYKISAEQLFIQRKARKIIPLTLSADLSLGGGIPLGCTVLIGGKQKSGKSTTCLQYAANAQNLFGSKVFIYPTEGRLTNQTMDQVSGLKKEDVIVVLPPAILNKKGELLGHGKFNAEMLYTSVGETIKENPNSIIIVDSISNMSSERELTEGIGFMDRGGLNKIESQFCRIYGDLIIANNVTLFLIAQIQANTSGYGIPIQMKAGNQIRHQADVVMFCKSIEKWDEQNERICGHNILISIETSALGPPYVDTSIPLRYGKGIDLVKDLIKHAIVWGYIKRAGTWYYLPFKENDPKNTIEIPSFDDEEAKSQGLIKTQGEEKTWTFFSNEENKEKLDILNREIRSKLSLALY